MVKIHAPYVGSDLVLLWRLPPTTGPVSIHTPRMGSDTAWVFPGPFSPQFQSTLPIRGATTLPAIFRWSSFNPHSSQQELPPHFTAKFFESLPDRATALGHVELPNVFKSPLHARGVTAQAMAHGTVGIVSIHALRMGSDPEGGPTVTDLMMSIHTPRMGSDRTPMAETNTAAAFQSTLTVWGVTCRH